MLQEGWTVDHQTNKRHSTGGQDELEQQKKDEEKTDRRAQGQKETRKQSGQKRFIE